MELPTKRESSSDKLIEGPLKRPKFNPLINHPS